MKNDLRIWTPRTRWIRRTSWTPDCFVSGKDKVLKIIKTDSLINITRAYTEIFPKPDKKKRHFLPTKDRYSSVRCVILKDKARCLNYLRKTLLEFVFLGQRFQYKRDYNILLFENTANHFFKLQDCIQSAKIGKGPSIMEKYPILQICRTERFKDSLISSPAGNLLHGFREMPPCIRKGSCMQRSAQIKSFYRYSERTLLSSFRFHFLHLYH